MTQTVTIITNIDTDIRLMTIVSGTTNGKRDDGRTISTIEKPSPRQTALRLFQPQTVAQETGQYDDGDNTINSRYYSVNSVVRCVDKYVMCE